MIKGKNLFWGMLVMFSFMSCTTAQFSGHSKKIQLMGNPTTGYSWVYEVGDDSIIQVEEDIQYLGDNGITGAPSLYMYTISSLQPGSTTLKFEYKRYWEKTNSEQVKLYEISVKDNGKIIMSEK